MEGRVRKGIPVPIALVARFGMAYYGQIGMFRICSRGFTVINTVCSQCDKVERQCTCEKYCCHCHSQFGVRMAVDGIYYCPDCREACDVALAESDDK